MKRDIFDEWVCCIDSAAAAPNGRERPFRYTPTRSVQSSLSCKESLHDFAALEKSGYICPEPGRQHMIIVPLAEAKNNLSKLVDDAAAGQIITIAKHGRPMARLVPVERPRGQRIGAMKGKIVLTDDFDSPLPDDLLEAFEGHRP
ncbi:type II toxin-antitoxin system Phd/YefM family antitoxin [Pseudomonas fluorescens]|uniref:type II toxin-antitoxin system Phd/YefM family antitoxin n=1 Tax=Pseudomonas fluorescens TaxID=294 RepID=UPI00352417C9